MYHQVPLVLGDGAQLWQSKPPYSTLYVLYENGFAQVASEKLMARNLSPHCYIRSWPATLRIYGNLHNIWAMHLVLPLKGGHLQVYGNHVFARLELYI